MQNVATPRFYVNILEYLDAIGYTEINNIYRTNPNEYKAFESTDMTQTSVPENIFTDKSFVAFLGHKGGVMGHNQDFNNNITVNAQINGSNNKELNPEKKGFSIRSFDGSIIDYTRDDAIQTTWVEPICSIVYGNYYDMPVTPDLNVRLSYDYDGIKNIETKGGATLSHALYTKPADWGDYGCWQLGENTNIRSGRRIWDLSFSFLTDRAIFPVNAASDFYAEQDSTTHYEADDITNLEFNTNLIEGDDFFSQVWNRTMANHLPFIFQPDGSNPNPDQFAICRFDMNSLRVRQKMHRKYEVKLKIKEVW